MKKNEEFNLVAYKNNFIKENYDRINLTVPKGRKEIIRKKASGLGMSVNEYINSLINLSMEDNDNGKICD